VKYSAVVLFLIFALCANFLFCALHVLKTVFRRCVRTFVILDVLLEYSCGLCSS